MKIEVSRVSFAELFGIAASVVPMKSPKNAIKNVLIASSSDGSIVLSATDLELSIRIATQANSVMEPGSILVPVSRFSAILKEASGDAVQIESAGFSAKITTGGAKFTIPLTDPEEFPTIESIGDLNYAEIMAGSFKYLSRMTTFAADSESSRFALSGVMIEVDGSTINAVATDGRRMSWAPVATSVIGEMESTAIVPVRSIQLIDRMLMDDGSIVRVSWDSNQLRLKAENIEVQTRLVEGRFPKWRDAIPKERESLKLSIVAGTLHAALRQAAIVADKETRGVSLAFEAGTLAVSASTSEVGSASISVPIAYDGEPMKTELDLWFLTDLVRALPPDSMLDVDIAGPTTAALFSAAHNYRYVLMPLTRNK
jgi:DNA polymerase III subunit beta